MPFCQIFLLARSHMPANQHQFLDDISIFVSSKNWCLLASKLLRASKKIWQNGIFIIIFMIYFNILNSLGLVQWVEPIDRLRHGVNHFLVYIQSSTAVCVYISGNKSMPETCSLKNVPNAIWVSELWPN